VLTWLRLLCALTEVPQTDELIRRLALWVMRETLMSWVLAHPGDVRHFSWFMHVVQCVGESLPGPAGEGGVPSRSPTEAQANTHIRVPTPVDPSHLLSPPPGGQHPPFPAARQPARYVPAWLRVAVVQELRLFLAAVHESSVPGTVADLASVLEAMPASRPSSYSRQTSWAGEGMRGQSGYEPPLPEPSTYVLSVETDDSRRSLVDSPGQSKFTRQVILGRCGQTDSLRFKREAVSLGAVEVLVKLTRHLIKGEDPQQKPPSTGEAPGVRTEFLGALACLSELLTGCREGKTRVGQLVGFEKIPELYDGALECMHLFLRTLEASVDGRLVPFQAPFTRAAFRTLGKVPDVAGDASTVRTPSETDSEVAAAGGTAREDDRDLGHHESHPGAWAIMPVFFVPAPLATKCHDIFFPQLHIASLPTCSSLASLWRSEAMSTSAHRNSPVSSVSSSRPTSRDFSHADRDLSFISRSGKASSIASQTSSQNLNFKLKLADANHPHTGTSFTDYPPYEEKDPDEEEMESILDVDPFSLHLSSFFSPEASLLPFLVLSTLAVDQQPAALHTISRLLDANPLNCRALSDVHTAPALLRLACHAPDQVQPLCLQLLAQLLSYSAKPDEVRLLFDLAGGSAKAWSAFLSDGREGDAMLSDRLLHQALRPRGGSVWLADSGVGGGKGRHIRRDLQMQLLYVIGRVVEHRAPNTFFHLTGSHGGLRLYLKDRLTSVKGGYTLTCWMRPTAFPNEPSVALFSVVGSGRTYVELQFVSKRSRRVPSDTISAYLRLVVRIDLQDPPQGASRLGAASADLLPLAPATYHVITLQDFECHEGGAWHHVALAHGRSGIAVYVDGRAIGEYESTESYPALLTEKNLSINVGYPGSVRQEAKGPSLSGSLGAYDDVPPLEMDDIKSTFLSGQVGPVSLMEGAWDEGLASIACTRFSLDEITSVNLGRRIIHVDPSQFMPTLPWPEDMQQPKTPGSVSSGSALTGGEAPVVSLSGAPAPATAPAPTGLGGVEEATSISSLKVSDFIFSRLSGREEDRGPLPLTANAIGLGSGLQVHHTQALTQCLEDVGGLSLCLPFFVMGPEQQVAALRLLGGMMRSSPKIAKMFTAEHGYCVLFHLLTASLSFITIDIFDVIFDLTTCGAGWTGGITQAFGPARAITRPPGLVLAVDVLCYCSHDLGMQIKVLEGLVDLLDDNVANAEVWHSSLGLVAVLRLMSLNPTACDDGEHPFPQQGYGAMKVSASLPSAHRAHELVTKLVRVIITGSTSVAHPIVRSPATTSSAGALVTGFTGDDLGLLMSYIATRREDSHPRLLMLLVQLLQDPGGTVLLGMLPTCLGPGQHWLLALELLASPVLDVRLLAIQLLCLLLMRSPGVMEPKALAQFEKIGGFAVMCEHLGHFPPDTATCDALLSLILGRWAVMTDHPTHKSTKSRDRDSDSWLKSFFFSSGQEDAGSALVTESGVGPSEESILTTRQADLEKARLSDASPPSVVTEVASEELTAISVSGRSVDHSQSACPLDDPSSAPSSAVGATKETQPTLFSKFFRRRSHDHPGDDPFPLVSPPGSRRNSDAGLTALDLEGLADESSCRDRRRESGDTASLAPTPPLPRLPDDLARLPLQTKGGMRRRHSESGSLGEAMGPVGAVFAQGTTQLAIALPQALEVLLFVLRKATSPRVLIHSLEGLEATFSPDYCRRGRGFEDAGDDGVALAEHNMSSVMAQKSWMMWFHGLANALLVRSADEADAAPLEFHDRMAYDLNLSGTPVSDSGSYLGSEDGYDAYAEASAVNIGDAVESFLEPVHEVVVRLLMYDIRLYARSSSRRFADLFKIPDAQVGLRPSCFARD
jgi:hypothetical protein